MFDSLSESRNHLIFLEFTLSGIDFEREQEFEQEQEPSLTIKRIERGEVKETTCTKDYISVCLRTAIKRNMYELVVKLLSHERCIAYGINPNYKDAKGTGKFILHHVCIVGNNPMSINMPIRKL